MMLNLPQIEHQELLRYNNVIVYINKYSLPVINTDMNGRVCGALVQFGCYQYKIRMNVKASIFIRLSLNYIELE